MIKLKFAFKGLQFPKGFLNIDKEKILLLKSDWSNMLSHQIANLLPVDHFLGQIDRILSAILGDS